VIGANLGSAWKSLGERVVQLFASKRWRVARNGVLAGLLGGALSSAYRVGIAVSSDVAHRIYAYLGERPGFVALWAVAALAATVVVWRLLQWEPMSSGSGIPQVKGILNGVMTMRPVPVVVARFLGGTTGSLFGLSLGREGPSIHIGAAVGQMLSAPLKATPEEERHLLTSGASAGLSAAFNAPVSGMLFGIEGLHRSFSPLVIASASTGALAADAVSRLAFGPHPILQFGQVEELALPLLWVVIPLGVLTGLAGALVNRLLLGAQTWMARFPGPARIPVALLLALPCGLWLPQVLGGGEDLIGWAEFEATGIGLVLLLLAVKMAFTATSFGCGIPGGIFMPILAIGTLTGSAYALMTQYAGLPVQYQSILAVCGMAGVLAASVRTPLTSILLTAEMTGSLAHLLPVAIVVIIAVFTADALRVPPIYEALLNRALDRTR